MLFAICFLRTISHTRARFLGKVLSKKELNLSLTLALMRTEIIVLGTRYSESRSWDGEEARDQAEYFLCTPDGPGQLDKQSSRRVHKRANSVYSIFSPLPLGEKSASNSEHKRIIVLIIRQVQ